MFAQSPCSGGLSDGTYPCDGLTMQSYISSATMGSIEATDSWGWTDTDGNSDEYAIVGLNDGTAFVNISDPLNPVYLGRMDSYTGTSYWRDVKVYNNHAYIVSDSNGNHGVQIFDLTRLRGLNGTPVQDFHKNGDGRYGGISYAHNVIINEDTGYLYILGSNRNSGAPRIMDLSNPTSLSIAGNVPSSYGYCHDAQVLIYDGPDTEHVGKELLIGSFSGSDFVKILDVTNKSNISEIGSVSYTNKYYTHQGWFTEDRRFFIVGDEVDETNIGFNTRTLVFDMQDLDNPVLHYTYYGPSSAIDHNGYVRGNRFYLANYSAGMRILKVDGLYEDPPSMTEIDYFDVFPGHNNASFDGTWNVYPFFESGNLVVTGFGGEHTDGDGGLFILRDPNYDDVDPVVACQNITATLNAAGTVTITALQVDGGSTDNIGITKRSIDVETFTCDNLGPNTVTLTIEDDYGNKSTCTTTVTVEAQETIYNGSSWSNGIPGPGSNAKISQSYNTSSDGGSIEACSCEVDATKTLTIAGSNYLDVNHDITVNGDLIVEHEGSVVQKNDNALTTNNGAISVRKTTPNLGGKDFMILGSPMSSESREGVYGSGRRVLSHNTDLFVPNGAVGGTTENFVDDNNNNWEIHNGALTLAEGYLVKPQAPGANPVGGQFALDYTLGTLNNGEILYTLKYNGSRLASPNMLGNPYASAIDIDLFLGTNTLVDAVYYWQHLTPPNDNFPGFNQLNFNLGDISVYNEGSGGSAASNGGGIPTQLMASGQGFAVKALGAGDVIFNNSMRVTSPNTDYRNPENDDRQRVWLDVKDNSYGLISNMLLAFTQGATDGFEGKYDSRRLDTPISLYSILDSEEELAIQGRSAFNEGQEVLLGFKTMVEEEQTYSISIRQIEGELISNTPVYLYDKTLNIATNLSESNYEFTSFAATYNDRFYILFKNPTVLGTNDTLEGISIYPNPTQDFITLVSPINTIESVIITDERGREINAIYFTDEDSYTIDLSKLDNALYFFTINTTKGSIVKRAIKK